MEQKYKEYLAYVENKLSEGTETRFAAPFRSRYHHTLRVLKWAERISEGREDVDMDILITATIFHDIGHHFENHQQVSADMFMEYAKKTGMDEGFSKKVYDCIAIHSEKMRLQNPNTLTIEQILLMEADALDEEGALAVCWDGLTCGYKGATSYEQSLEHSKHGLYKLSNNYLVTEKARSIWDHKQEFLKQYVDELSYDLEELS